jgi:hypothetical protein
MKRILFALLISLFMMQVSASGQFKAPSPVRSDRPPSKVEAPISQPRIETEQGDELILAAHAIASLKWLGDDVLVYRSLGDFETDGRLALVPFEVFKNDSQKVTAEVEPILSRLPQSRLKIEISNTLDSYRDGEIWWERIHQARVENVSAMTFAETSVPARSMISYRQRVAVVEQGFGWFGS